MPLPRECDTLIKPITCCRLLELAAWQVPWEPCLHERFPPAFRRAARTLLLAQRRAAGGGPPASSVSSLLSIEPELMLKVIELSAYPLSTWL